MLGSEFAKYYHYYILISSFLCNLLYTAIHFSSPFEMLFLLAYIPIARHLYVVYTNKNPQLLDPELKKLALSTFFFAILFGIGLFI